MKVLKFGGTSVGSSDALSRTLTLIEASYRSSECRAIVVSALSKVTDTLLLAANSAAHGEDTAHLTESLYERHRTLCEAFLPASTRSRVIAWFRETFHELEDILRGVRTLKECTTKSSDLIVSFGERCAAYLVTSILQSKEIPARFVDARDIIRTDDSFARAEVQFEITNVLIKKNLSTRDELPIITGFIAASYEGDTTTLGRGGSDYTAAIVGAALEVDEIEIWTDVEGIMTADPRTVTTALPIPWLSYEEAMELSHFGAKVIYPPSIQPAYLASIPVRIRNTFNPTFPGSVIHTNPSESGFPVTGISSIDAVALLRVQGSGLQGISGTAARIFRALASKRINVIFITQASSEHTICLAVQPGETSLAVTTLSEEFTNEMERGKVDPIVVDQDLSILSVVGDAMRHTPGISARLFQALGSHGINIVAIAQGSSELNISVVIASKDRNKAVNAVHDAFFLADHRTGHLFVIGDGLIGSTLLQQINEHKSLLRERYALDVKLVGITNTKWMRINQDGLPVQTTLDDVTTAHEPASLDTFIEKAVSLELPHCVLVDCSASDLVPTYYPKVLRESVSIVTPNKRGISGTLELYDSLKKIEKKRSVRFLYETCVGAGLPVISTLHDLLKSGDEIIKIEAVLSGTLSYLFNQYTGVERFADVVREAQQLGYTEPDPRDDLSGTDVARKVLILAREIGLRLELKDIITESLVPAGCLNAKTVPDFYTALEKENGYFHDKITEAQKSGKKLRYVGVIDDGKAYTKLMSVDADHPFYSLSGSDNIISFTTSRYKSRPLVVKGPGAGPAVTAAGVFADIVRIIQ